MRGVIRALVATLAATALALAGAGYAQAANGDNLRQINADTNGTACGDSAGGFKVGVGLAFDGTNLLVSCYNDSTVTAVSPVDGSQVAIHTISGASSLGALAWDNGRGLLWACSAFDVVGTIDLTTDVFTPRFTSGCFDGLAYDGADDSVWTSDDASFPVYHRDATSGALLGSFSQYLGGYGNSGIAVGGPNLYLANNGGSQIYVVPKDFSSSTLFATFPRRLEDMECDNLSFPGKGAIWSKDAYDNILNAWEIPDGSCIFGGGRSDLTLAPSDATNDVGTSHTVTATLTDRDGPVAAASILFTVTGANTASGSDTTDGAGEATFTYTGTNAGDDTITACYDKDGNGSCDSGEPTATATKHWIVRTADLAIAKSGPAYAASGGTITYQLTVTNNGPANATGVTVTDTLPAGETLVSATPSQGSCSGSVTCSLGSIADGGTATITIVATVTAPSGSTLTNSASVAGDQPDDASGNDSASASTFVYGLAAGGAFVIGDGNAAVGTAVTFWGAQWWKSNTLSGGAAPASFKGFETTGPAACGLNWTTTTGNSPPPPPGPLPAYMAVIVSSSVSQSGSTISGNTPHVVIVQTNAGYDANPGHAGTGTVYARVC